MERNREVTDPARQSLLPRAGDRPPHIVDRYRRLALVSHRRHLEALDPADETTLVVASDWLLGERSAADGWHCVHGESEWDGPRLAQPRTDIFERAIDWAYVDGEDATVFRGVSLGRKFAQELQRAILEHERLQENFSALVSRYRPQEILFFDFRTELNTLDPSRRLAIVSRLADTLGVAIVDRSDMPDAAEPDHRARANIGGLIEVKERLKQWAIERLYDVFDRVTDILSRLRRAAGGKRPALLMVVTQLTGIPLIERFDGKGLYPLYLARWFPRKRNLGFLARALAKGVLLVGAPKAHLVEADHRALDGIRRRLEAAWETPGEVTEIETREHVRTCIFACHRMEEMARLVVWADRVLKRHTPQGVFADSVLNPLVNIFFELAKRKGIATLGTWHGPEQFDVKMFVYGSDPRVPAPLDACLTWGKSHEDWLVNTSGTSTPIRTGNVIASQYREERTTTASSDGLVGGRKGKRALVLQNTCPWYDAGVPLTNEYVLFVETIRMLRDLGYTDIRFKLHPGIPVMAQYQEIARHFSLHCDIFQDGEFKDFVAWADFVIGPVHSGAMLEVLASGKPYYPILLPHSTLNRKYVAAGQTFPDMESLRQALAAGKTPDHDAYLQNYTSLEDIPDPAARTWEVVKEKLNPVESKVEVEAWSLPQHPRG